MAKPSEAAAAAPIVYVIDDDDGMRRALSLLLSTVGYKTLVFASPGDFLAHFDPDTHGCLVLDIRMPGMSGLELQQHLNRTGSMLPVNRPVRAVTRDGKVITGRRLNEDTYTVQLIDEQEHLVSLTKTDLLEYTVLKTSSMPTYQDKLSAQELADLEAYLLSLKGVK